MSGSLATAAEKAFGGNLLGSAGGGLASGGMSLLLPLLMSFGPALVSKLFGGQDPNDKLRQQVAMLMSPGYQNQLHGQFLNSNINSPAFTAGQNAIAAGANQTANNVSERLGAHGLNASGTSDILNSMRPSLVGNNTAQLYATADQAAQAQAMQAIQQQLQALYGTQGPSQDMQYAAAGLSNFAPYLLTSWLKSNYPGMFPSAGTNAAGGAPAAPTSTFQMPRMPSGSSATSMPAPAGGAPTPTGSLASLYAPNAGTTMNPATMSMMQPGMSTAGMTGMPQGHEWTPPAVRVGRN